MIYFTDNDGCYKIGVVSVEISPEEIKKYIEDVVICDLVEAYEDDSEDFGINTDTIVLLPNQFDEAFLDLCENGVSLFIRNF